MQWNLEGGSITDLSSNSSSIYYNFDSFDQIQVTTGGGDVSVQSSGLAINLVTKSGSNVFKGTAIDHLRERQDAVRATSPRSCSTPAPNGFLSGNPLQKIAIYSIEAGGPIVKDRLWFWGSADHQDINVGVAQLLRRQQGRVLRGSGRGTEEAVRWLGAITFDNLDEVQGCLNNDKTIIKNLHWKINYQLNSSNKFQYLFQSDNKIRNRRGASSTNAAEATTQQFSDAPWNLPMPTHSLTHTWIASDKLVFNNQFTYVGGGFFLDYQDVPPQGDCLQSRYLGSDRPPAI